jgi:hypothetical protein
MKKIYNVGDDLFLAIAFVTFIVGGVLRLLGISTLFWGITARDVIQFSVMCLLFSIALSLYDLAHGQK